MPQNGSRVTRPPVRPRLRRMLEGRTVAVVGASDRPDSFGERMTTEVLRSPGVRARLAGQPRPDARCWGGPACRRWPTYPSRSTWCCSASPTTPWSTTCGPRPRRGDGGAVVYGAAHGLGDELVSAADGLALCGGGCMGFVNAVRGVRAIGYLERDPVPAGPIALVTHSGLGVLGDAPHPPPPGVLPGRLLRAGAGHHRPPTTSPTRSRCPRPASSAWCSRRCGTRAPMRAVLADAAARDVPVVALTVGTSSRGRSLVDAHSGALAGSDAAWEALFAAYGVHRVDDLDELADSLECFAIGRRVRRRAGGIATVHDSGAERVLAADVAERARRPVRAPVGGHHGAAGQRSSTRGSSRPTRSTCGAPARTPRACSPTA